MTKDQSYEEIIRLLMSALRRIIPRLAVRDQESIHRMLDSVDRALIKLRS